MLLKIYSRARWPYWAAFGFIGFAGFGLLFDWNKSEWASWVQAVGSIAAIVAAILISSDQHRQALQREERAEAQRIAQLLGVPLAVAERVMAQMQRCADHVRKPPGYGGDWGPSSDYLPAIGIEIERFGGLPLQELPYSKFKSAYEFLDLLREAQRLLETAVRIRDQESQVPQRVFRDFEVAVGQAEVYYRAMGEEWIAALKTARVEP